MDNDTRDVLITLTREVSRLSALVERTLETDKDTESRMRKLEKWMHGLPVAYLLSLGTLFTTLTRHAGK